MFKKKRLAQLEYIKDAIQRIIQDWSDGKGTQSSSPISFADAMAKVWYEVEKVLTDSFKLRNVLFIRAVAPHKSHHQVDQPSHIVKGGGGKVVTCRVYTHPQDDAVPWVYYLAVDTKQPDVALDQLTKNDFKITQHSYYA